MRHVAVVCWGLALLAAGPTEQEKAILSRFSDAIKPVIQDADAEVEQIKASTKSQLDAMTQELKAINKEQHDLLRATESMKKSGVEKNRRKHELQLREAVLKAQAAHVRSYGAKKADGIARRAAILRSRLASQGEALCKKVRRGEEVTEADISAALQACQATTPCPQCKGTGRCECKACDGKGTRRRQMKCPDCLGKGEVWMNPDVKNPDKALAGTSGVARCVPCSRCKGEGDVTLDVPCLDCFGAGSLECTRCWGKGTLVDAPK